MLVTAIAISVFFATDFILLLTNLEWIPGAAQTELIEFVGDILTASLLTIAFTMRVDR